MMKERRASFREFSSPGACARPARVVEAFLLGASTTPRRSPGGQNEPSVFTGPVWKTPEQVFHGAGTRVAVRDAGG